jgi:AcrR family transcriptional regulator
MPVIPNAKTLDRELNLEPYQDLNLPSEVDLTSFSSFLTSFPLQGERIYQALFDQHSELIQTQKAKFATANLEKIMNATFEISSNSGFDKMSLRDLSKRTGMSMGSIYSCITKKEDITIMVAAVVRLSSELTRQHAMRATSYWSQIEQSIRFHIYASTILQPWYFFLYFETRSLPLSDQLKSKSIELGAIASFQSQIEAGIDTGEFKQVDAKMLANTIVVLLEDWYLKPWKTQSLSKHKHVTDEQQAASQHETLIHDYCQSINDMVKILLIGESTP